MPSAFTGGALSFKGDKKKKKKAKKKESQAKHKLKDDPTILSSSAAAALEEDMTPAERKAMKRKRERELIDHEKLATKSHRERVEEFNEKLGNLTELNDIPRVSATISTVDGRIQRISYTLFSIDGNYRSALPETDSARISPPSLQVYRSCVGRLGNLEISRSSMGALLVWWAYTSKRPDFSVTVSYIIAQNQMP
jgi:protein FAM32A